MDVFIKGKGKVSLGQGDFVAQGGQGAVYAKGDTAYKIYADPGKMIPSPKYRNCAALTLPTIIRPWTCCWTRAILPSATPCPASRMRFRCARRLRARFATATI